LGLSFLFKALDLFERKADVFFQKVVQELDKYVLVHFPSEYVLEAEIGEGSFF